jgi:hypothetical protein
MDNWLQRIAVVLAIWYGDKAFTESDTLSNVQLHSYRAHLENTRYMLIQATERRETSRINGWIVALIMPTLEQRISLANDLLKLNPLMIGRIKK